MKQSKGISFADVIKILLIIVAIALIVILSLMGSYVLSVLKQAPVIDPNNYRSLINETSKIYSDDGQLVESLVLNEFSEYVTLDKIPKHLQKAVIAVEDERFYDHNGLDLQRVAGAIIYDIKNRSLEQGASTLTMQLAKNLYTSSAKDFNRKITDVFYAFNLENKLSKDQILEAYLNSAGFSKGTVGVQAAAKTFFDKDVSDLTLAESALIAGVTNRPGAYSPYNNAYITADDDLETVPFVLQPLSENGENSEETVAYAEKLFELGRIDQFDLSQIKGNILIPMKAEFNPNSKKRQELILRLMAEQGYITAAERDDAVNEDIVIKIGRRSEKGVSNYFIDEVKNETVEILQSLGYSKEDAQAKLYNGGFKIISSMQIDMQKHLEEVTSNARYFPGSRTDDAGIPQPQVASVVMNPHNGEVKALVGGRGIAGGALFNRAVKPRQPGSSIKPISVYMTALMNGSTAADVYLDEPIPSRVLGTSSWRPQNVSGYYGWQTIRDLIRRSSNVGAILVGRDIGSDLDAHTRTTYSTAVDTDKANQMMIDNLKALGVTTAYSLEDNPEVNDANSSALALGGMTVGISPLEMAGAYTPLANEGIYQKPTFVNQIATSTGKILYQKKPVGPQHMTPAQAFIMTDMLQDVVRRGTGTNANFPGMPIAGKTGTTNRQRDAWFVGYTPYYLCSVWIGNDRNERLPFMSSAAATLWKNIMRPIHEDLERKEFEQPEDVEKRYIRAIGRSEYFEKGTTPHFTNKMGWSDGESTKKKSDEDKNTNNNKKDNAKKKDNDKKSNSNNNDNE
ncbi:transglycosylase domain-containing protein [Peptoniphilus equinus]|uniref:Transglycosylase domain-containing protein n=1 Tax=Peptoniphilus equinus TaxID=3016343 RepID=A0ABY7QWG8_9FIRM|nr:transglycosylase domain-containing protein [Peptoniphilus equinus]WBW50444.1 transglycosylase domain-containing protein [Peptoniphilus equinus]